MSEQRCETCQHWENPWDGPPWHQVDEPGWGVCSRIGLPERDVFRDIVGEVKTIAYTQDGSDYRADLHTRSDFGCVLWTAREDPPT